MTVALSLSAIPGLAFGSVGIESIGSCALTSADLGILTIGELLPRNMSIASRMQLGVTMDVKSHGKVECEVGAS